MMADTDLDELAADIKANGLREPIVFWRDVHGGDTDFVLDGRNRLEALARAGMLEGLTKCIINADVDVDPGAYVISANIHRRHLTKAEQAELILQTLEAAKPTDRATVARSVPRAGNGHVHGSTRDPVLAAAVTEAKKHGISKRTVQRARANVQSMPTRRRLSRPIPRPTHSVPDVVFEVSLAVSKVLQEIEAGGRSVRELKQALRHVYWQGWKRR
jgi:hypothetical protein